MITTILAIIACAAVSIWCVRRANYMSAETPRVDRWAVSVAAGTAMFIGAGLIDDQKVGAVPIIVFMAALSWWLWGPVVRDWWGARHD